MTRDRMRALRYSNDDVEAVTRLVELHLRFHGYGDGVDRQRRAPLRPRRRAAARPAQRADPLRLHDPQPSAGPRSWPTAWTPSKARIAELREQEELDAIRPDLDGNQVMAQLGIGPGRQVGQALAFLLELRLDEGPLGEEEAAAAWPNGGPQANVQCPLHERSRTGRQPRRACQRSGATSTKGIEVGGVLVRSQ